MNTISVDKKGVRMIAHRGVSGLEMENTLAAFVAAGNRSHFGIETDVHVTSDGKFAIIHDDNTSRVSAENKVVEETTLEELQSIRLYDKQEGKYRTDLYIPVLAEYIKMCKKYEKKAVLELKNRMKPEDIAGIVEVIKEQDYLDEVIFISFSWENLIDLRALVPDQKAQFLISKNVEGLVEKLVAAKLDLDIYHKALTPELIQALHENGREVNCWTVDTAEDAEKYIAWGVDYITSNILE